MHTRDRCVCVTCAIKFGASVQKGERGTIVSGHGNKLAATVKVAGRVQFARLTHALLFGSIIVSDATRFLSDAARASPFIYILPREKTRVSPCIMRRRASCLALACNEEN